MGQKTSIEWTDASWSPIRARHMEIQDDGSGKERIGWHCERVSEGCRNCYAERMNLRLGTGVAFKPGELFREERKGFRNGEVKLFLDEKMLLQPLHWKRPRMVFVCSMTDLFADFVPDEMIDQIFAVMALASQHTFQVLTKRAERMRDYLRRLELAHAECLLRMASGRTCDSDAIDAFPHYTSSLAHPSQHGLYPLPNVWLGVSTEDQRRAEERVPLLLDTPSAIRFVSAEPLIGPIDFRKLMLDEYTWVDAITGYHSQQRGPGPVDQVFKEFTPLPPKTGRVHQIITGGESGPNARPMHPQWPRDIHKQCSILAAFFHKQNGEFASVSAVEGPGAHFTFPDGATVRRVGKKAAGRLLDGVEHNGFPSVQGRAL